MSRTVLVTGASGFVGRDLVVRLARSGWHVRAAARHSSAVPQHCRIEPMVLPDLARPFDWRPLLAGATHVVHLAGIAHARVETPPATYALVNAEAVRSLAGAARSGGIERIVLMSSVRAQSGPVAGGVLTEADRPQPSDAYGRSKLIAEQLLAETLADSDTGFAVLRPVLVYGSGVKGNMRALMRVARLRLPVPFGSLANRRSILSLANLAGAVLHVLTTATARNGTFLIADPIPVTIGEIVTALRAARGRPAGILPVPAATARALATLAGQREAWDRIAGNLVVDTTRLVQSGWQPVETSREGLARWARDEVMVPVWPRTGRTASDV
jgi:UDP-glucose 4-epimerase